MILDIDNALTVGNDTDGAWALARVNFKGKDKGEIDRELVWEAIRGSDSLLRAWFERARVETLSDLRILN